MKLNANFCSAIRPRQPGEPPLRSTSLFHGGTHFSSNESLQKPLWPCWDWDKFGRILSVKGETECKPLKRVLRIDTQRLQVQAAAGGAQIGPVLSNGRFRWAVRRSLVLSNCQQNFMVNLETFSLAEFYVLWLEKLLRH